MLKTERFFTLKIKTYQRNRLKYTNTSKEIPKCRF